MRQTLNLLHGKLAINTQPELKAEDGTPLNGTVLEQLRAMLDLRLTSSDRFLTYNLLTHRDQIELWIKYVSSIQAKGLALLSMYQAHRLVRAKKTRMAEAEYKQLEELVAGEIAYLSKVCDEREAAYRALLYKGVIAYPSSKILLKEAQIKTADSCPTLYRLHIENTGRDYESYLRVCRDTAEFQDRGVDQGQPNFQQAFAFVPIPSNGTWALRGSRFDAHPEGPTTWTVCRNDNDDQWGLFQTQ